MVTPTGLDSIGIRSYEVFRVLARASSFSVLSAIEGGMTIASEICKATGIAQVHASTILIPLVDTKVLLRRESLKKFYTPYVYRENPLLSNLRQKTLALAHSLQVSELAVYRALSSSPKTTTAVLHIYSGVTWSVDLVKVMGLVGRVSYAQVVLKQCANIGIVKIQQLQPDIYGVLYSGIRPGSAISTEYVLVRPEVVEIIGIARDIHATRLH